jgi:glutathione synthase/RimK-type ligase-like ATP-grasp enzyme
MTPSSVFKNVLRFVYAVRKTNYAGVTFKSTNIVVWAKIWSIKFFAHDEFVQAMAQINALSDLGLKFNVRFGTRIGDCDRKNVIVNYSRKIDPFKFKNYTQTVYYVCKQLEAQGCTVFPKSHEVLYWENKGYMTQQFLELGISTPKTVLLSSEADIDKINLPYPYLIKEEHSFSSEGLYKIKNLDDLLAFFKGRDYFSSNKYLLVQELLDMRRDLRVILVGDEIVLHYWRINDSDEWRPTATSYGNSVDFGNFPEQWRSFIIAEFKKLGITTGAFDIAWRKDDLSTTPLVLEVSSNYQPNPVVDMDKLKYGYGDYKKKILFRNAYEYRFVDVAFKIIRKYIEVVLPTFSPSVKA